MSGKKRRVYSRAFKLSVIARMEGGERVSDIARDLGVAGARFYGWMKLYRAGGAENLRLARRPLKVWGNEAPKPAKDLGEARRRISELERKIGQQQVELDFFRRALRQVEATRQPSDTTGVTASTRSCKR
jgi:transposase-like protein